MAEALIIVFNKLSTFVSQQGKLLGGLQQEVELLRDEFGHMKAFLEGAESNEEDDPRLTEWIRQVRDVAFHTEAVLDEYMLLSARRHPDGFFGYMSSNFNSIKNLPARRQLASKLQRIKARIKVVHEARVRYESQYYRIPAETSRRLAANNVWRHSKDDEAIYGKEAQLVGIEKHKQYLIFQLLKGNSQLKVISLLGMGGIGKTTLARKVHDDPVVKSHFQIHVWVNVSQTYDLKELLKGLIRQLQEHFKAPALPSMESMEIFELKAHVQNFLQRARYAIVFDDVWDRGFWDSIRFVFPENSCGGNCVMLTTRDGKIANDCSYVESCAFIYIMDYLSFQDSWTLFCRKTFKNNSCPAHLKNVVEGIVRKCGGLPLVIVAISGVLASKNLSRVNEWERVVRRLGDEYEDTGKLERAKKILCLSYNDLAPNLKTCLLYTSIFPGNRIIRSYHLIDLWIAERLVEVRDGMSAEEVAWDYLKELISRSLIQFHKAGYDGLPLDIRIHDLFREVLASESRKINLLTIVGRQLPKNMVKRLVFHHNDNLLENCVAPNLQSLITFEHMQLPSKALLTQLLSSKFLKVLHLEGVPLEEIPKEICNLFLLTYLNLSESNVRKIPKSIKRLQNLEYLILSRTNVRELPAEIRKLQKLQHLFVSRRVIDSPYRHLSSGGFKSPCEMGALLALQSLQCIDATENDKTRIINEIGKMAQLRRLMVTNLRREDGKELCFSLEKLTNLQDLSVASSVEEAEVTILDLNHPISASSCLLSLRGLNLMGRLEKMPPWITSLENLRGINLMLSSLTDDPLETLQQLPNLTYAYLNRSYEGESLCFKAGGFPMLQNLFLTEMKRVRWVRVEKGAMPHIQLLILDSLPQLEDLPTGIEHLRQLQKLELWSNCSQLTKKLKNGYFPETQDYKRIAHVPQLILGYHRDGRRFWLSWKKETQVKGGLSLCLLSVVILSANIGLACSAHQHFLGYYSVGSLTREISMALYFYYQCHLPLPAPLKTLADGLGRKLEQSVLAKLIIIFFTILSFCLDLIVLAVLGMEFISYLGGV